MKRSGIITLITDFGLNDHYVAMMKGVIANISPSVRLIDITHGIKVGSISRAAGILREAFPFFPEGTIHVAVVDPGVGGQRRLIGLETKGHFFVGPDNGIFWPMIEQDENARVFELRERRYFLLSTSSTFHGRDVLAPVAANLSLGVDLSAMGPAIADPIQLELPKPYEKKEVLYGEIIRVDNFGNLIINIPQKELRDFLGSAHPVFEVGNLTIRGLLRTYADNEEGNPLALINSSGMLEIAVNLGRASEYLGMDGADIAGTIVKVRKA